MSDLVVSYSKIMRAEIERLESIAHNAANVNTQGYVARQSSIDQASFLQLLGHSSSPPQLLHSVNTQAGPLNNTGMQTDIAIAKDGWFLVSDGAKQFLTRKGVFELNARGELLVNDRYRLMGMNGHLSGLTDTFKVSKNGVVEQDGSVIGEIKILTVSNPETLVPEGEGIYRYTRETGLVEQEPDQIHLVQGAFNGSNVVIGDEMVKMMEISRHIESMQRAMSTYDELVRMGISELGQ